MLFIEPMYTLALENPDFDFTSKSNNDFPYLLRPGAKDFIARVAQDWEVMIFSSRKQEQISSLVDMLDPLKVHIKFVLSRTHCDITGHKRCAKDLSTIQNVNKNGSIIIDYKPQNVAYSIDSAIILMHWNGSEDDNELIPGLAQHLGFLSCQTEPAKAQLDKSNYAQFLSQIYKPGSSALN